MKVKVLEPPPQPSPAARAREQTRRFIEASRNVDAPLSRAAGEGGGLRVFGSNDRLDMKILIEEIST